MMTKQNRKSQKKRNKPKVERGGKVGVADLLIKTKPVFRHLSGEGIRGVTVQYKRKS